MVSESHVQTLYVALTESIAAFTLIAKDLGQRVEEATEGKVVK